MNIVERIIKLANMFDAVYNFETADELTKIANDISHNKLSSLINIPKTVRDQRTENVTQNRINDVVKQTDSLKKQNTIADSEDDNEREAGFTSLTTFKNDQLITNNLNKQIGQVYNKVQKLKESSKKTANFVNLTGLMNQQKQTNYTNNQIQKTVNTIGNMKATGSADDDKKTGERYDDNDAEAISLVTLPTMQKQQNSTQNNINRSLDRVESLKSRKTQ